MMQGLGKSSDCATSGKVFVWVPFEKKGGERKGGLALVVVICASSDAMRWMRVRSRCHWHHLMTRPSRTTTLRLPQHPQHPQGAIFADCLPPLPDEDIPDRAHTQTQTEGVIRGFFRLAWPPFLFYFALRPKAPRCAILRKCRYHHLELQLGAAQEREDAEDSRGLPDASYAMRLV